LQPGEVLPAGIDENLAEKIAFKELASELAVSRRNTAAEYLQRVNVGIAKKTPEKGRKGIFEVMNEVRYWDDSAFREVFKKITGVSRLDYYEK
jgi:YesN/AraC family two-component response regulator